MSRSARTATVVRVRELQARAAELEAVQRRLESDRALLAVERAVDDLDRRSASTGGTIDVTSLIGWADSLSAAASHVNVRRDLHAAADADAAESQTELIAAHRRQDAVERLFDRHRAAEAAEAERVERVELDDVVTARFGAQSKETLR